MHTQGELSQHQQHINILSFVSFFFVRARLHSSHPEYKCALQQSFSWTLQGALCWLLLNVSIHVFLSARSDILTNQLEASVCGIISLLCLKNPGLWILPFYFAVCLLPLSLHNSSVTLPIPPVPWSNNSSSTTTPTSTPIFEGVNQTGELNARLMRRRWELGD